MRKLLLTLPLGYFVLTRLNTKRAIIFHAYYEYLSAILLLIYFGSNVENALKYFGLGYLAFIALYEIGYIFNDYFSIKFEVNPRLRIKNIKISLADIIIFIALRISVFLAISYYLKVYSNYSWWIFYIALALMFYLHNILKSKPLKTFTFSSLAFFRFYAPIFPFLAIAGIINTLPGVILFYIFFRTLTYMDSKDLIKFEGRNTIPFKVHYYLLFLPVSIIISILLNHPFTVFFNIYFLLFWLSFLFVSKFNIVKI